MSTERKPLIAIGIEGSANKVSPFPCHSRTVWSGDYPKQRNALRDSIEHQKDIHIASGNGLPSPRNGLASSATRDSISPSCFVCGENDPEGYRYHLLYQGCVFGKGVISRTWNGRTTHVLCGSCKNPVSIVGKAPCSGESLRGSYRNGTSGHGIGRSNCAVCEWRKHTGHLLLL